MKHYLAVKNTILIIILILIGCDVSLLFAAQGELNTAGSAGTISTTTTSSPTAPTSAMSTPPILPPQAPPPGTSPAGTVGAPLGGAQERGYPPPPQGAPLQQTLPPPPTLPPPQTLPAPIQPPVPAQEPWVSAMSPEDKAQNEEAFNTMARNALPMSPEQIQRLRHLFSASQLAASAAPGTPPRPVATSQLVHLEPGATPPVIRLGQGFVSSLVFVDSTGAPWPIVAYDVGNPGAFNIQWDKTSNVLMIQATALYTYGNLAVRLKGLVTPVMLTLIPGQKAVDYRVDLRLPGAGPNATTAQVGEGLPNGANTELLSVLDGIPPAGSKTLEVTGGGKAQAWLLGDTLFVRTRLTILSPGWISTMSSADGMHAYEMKRTPTVLASMNGRVVQLKIEGL